MASAPASPASVTDLVRTTELAHSGLARKDGPSTGANAPQLEIDPPSNFSPRVTRLPVELDVTVPVRKFKVRNLVALAPGQVIESQWGHGDDVPLATRDVQLAWCEFEVIQMRLAVRVTRLA
jgi:flagellar motor switch protein FliM